MLCYAMLCYAMLCFAMLCYAMLRYAMLCYAMLCYAIHNIFIIQQCKLHATCVLPLLLRVTNLPKRRHGLGHTASITPCFTKYLSRGAGLDSWRQNPSGITHHNDGVILRENNALVVVLQAQRVHCKFLTLRVRPSHHLLISNSHFRLQVSTSNNSSNFFVLQKPPAKISSRPISCYLYYVLLLLGGGVAFWIVREIYLRSLSSCPVLFARYSMFDSKVKETDILIFSINVRVTFCFLLFLLYYNIL